MKTATKFIATLCASMCMAQAAVALETYPRLDLETASTMAAACEAKAKAEGWRMNIAVVDRGGDLLVFHRMDNAFLGSGDIAIGKAKTSAWFPFSTRFVGELAYGTDGGAPGVPGLDEVDGVIAFAGGLPVMAGDMHIGGIGISGDTADHDEACAMAALEAVSAALK